MAIIPNNFFNTSLGTTNLNSQLNLPAAQFGVPQATSPAQLMSLLGQLLETLSQLSQGFQNFAGGTQNGQAFQPSGPAGTLPQFPFGQLASPGTPTFSNAGGSEPFGSLTSIPTISAPTAQPPSNDFDFSALSKAERTQVSDLNDSGRAALHLWGIQMTSEGKQNGGIYFNVLNNPDQFQEAEVALVKDMYQKEMAMYGGVNGKLLDQHFFGVYEHMTGQDVSQRYSGAPVEFATGPVNMENRLTGNNGLSGFDNAVIRLWGHDQLDNGAMDGSIAQYTLGSDNAFDKDLNQGDIQTLLAADAADGTRDGNALGSAFIDSLDRLYFGPSAASGASREKTLARAGIGEQQVGSILDDLAKNPPPGVPEGVDITDMANIGKCPVLGPVVQQQGGIQF